MREVLYSVDHLLRSINFSTDTDQMLEVRALERVFDNEYLSPSDRVAIERAELHFTLLGFVRLGFGSFTSFGGLGIIGL